MASVRKRTFDEALSQSSTKADLDNLIIKDEDQMRLVTFFTQLMQLENKLKQNKKNDIQKIHDILEEQILHAIDNKQLPFQTIISMVLSIQQDLQKEDKNQSAQEITNKLNNQMREYFRNQPPENLLKLVAQLQIANNIIAGFNGGYTADISSQLPNLTSGLFNILNHLENVLIQESMRREFPILDELDTHRSLVDAERKTRSKLDQVDRDSSKMSGEIAKLRKDLATVIAELNVLLQQQPNLNQNDSNLLKTFEINKLQLEHSKNKLMHQIALKDSEITQLKEKRSELQTALQEICGSQKVSGASIKQKHPTLNSDLSSPEQLTKLTNDSKDQYDSKKFTYIQPTQKYLSEKPDVQAAVKSKLYEEISPPKSMSLGTSSKVLSKLGESSESLRQSKDAKIKDEKIKETQESVKQQEQPTNTTTSAEKPKIQSGTESSTVKLKQH